MLDRLIHSVTKSQTHKLMSNYFFFGFGERNFDLMSERSLMKLILVRCDVAASKGEIVAHGWTFREGFQCMPPEPHSSGGDYPESTRSINPVRLMENQKLCQEWEFDSWHFRKIFWIKKKLNWCSNVPNVSWNKNSTEIYLDVH